jgi:hypothetical protein
MVQKIHQGWISSRSCCIVLYYAIQVIGLHCFLVSCCWIIQFTCKRFKAENRDIRKRQLSE